MIKKTRRAESDLSGLPDTLKEKAEALIARLESEPALGKKLKGKLEGYRSMRLGRTHRIIYRSHPQLIVMTIVQRKDAYR